MRNVLILGAGISGLGAAHVLLKHGVSVLISDLKDTIQDKKRKKLCQNAGQFLCSEHRRRVYWMG